MAKKTSKRKQVAVNVDIETMRALASAHERLSSAGSAVATADDDPSAPDAKSLFRTHR